MKRVGFQFKVRQDRLAEYIMHHKHVWPEMLQTLRDAGWHNYSLFVRSDGLVFGRWQQFMAPFTDSHAPPDQSFIELDEYFHLD
jgi:L-rhamnose mutarotase